MTQLRIFENWDLDVQVSTFLTGDGEIFFKAKDVAQALGYSNMEKAVRTHVSEKYKVSFGDVATGENTLPNLGRVNVPVNHHPNTLFLREPGLYDLIFSSHLPAAVRFRDWVFEEVLPSIRKTGQYVLDDPLSKLKSITNEQLDCKSEEYQRECKHVFKEGYDYLKNEKAERTGQKGGLKSQENRRRTEEEKSFLEEKLNFALSVLTYDPLRPKEEIFECSCPLQSPR